MRHPLLKQVEAFTIDSSGNCDFSKLNASEKETFLKTFKEEIGKAEGTGFLSGNEALIKGAIKSGPPLTNEILQSLNSYCKKLNSNDLEFALIFNLNTHFDSIIAAKKDDPSLEIPDVFWASSSFAAKAKEKKMGLTGKFLQMKNLKCCVTHSR